MGEVLNVIRQEISSRRWIWFNVVAYDVRQRDTTATRYNPEEINESRFPTTPNVGDREVLGLLDLRIGLLVINKTFVGRSLLQEVNVFRWHVWKECRRRVHSHADMVAGPFSKCLDVLRGPARTR